MIPLPTALFVTDLESLEEVIELAAPVADAAERLRVVTEAAEIQKARATGELRDPEGGHGPAPPMEPGAGLRGMPGGAGGSGPHGLADRPVAERPGVGPRLAVGQRLRESGSMSDAVGFLQFLRRRPAWGG